MATMKAMQVQEPGGDFIPVEVDIPKPGKDQIRIKEAVRKYRIKFQQT